MAVDRWTKEQTIVAFNLYCKIPFQKASSTNPDIIRVAKIIGRSPNSVKMKIGNFGSFDPELKKKGIVGLANASALDKEIWDKFNGDWENLAFESEQLVAKFSNQNIEDFSGIDLNNLPIGESKERVVKTRVNQNFFRQTILSAYNSTCCITGLNISELLIASHIVPWSKKKEARLNPRNGLCLNALHDKAFDRGLITVQQDYTIRVSDKVSKEYNNENVQKWIGAFDGQKIILPERFVPNGEFLKYHNDNIFVK
ncbi:MAG: HNH endonuclease [Candidatus Pacebacteria bacterium]|nr:HNH endonuclease [Candidatus Paceibacterota bacterium]